MTILNQIYATQRGTGESVVIAHLKQQGLITATEPISPQAVINKLQGEAGVLRGLLKQCAGIILTIDSENDTESEMLDDLYEKIVFVIRGSA
jgi:hypothetical protein